MANINFHNCNVQIGLNGCQVENGAKVDVHFPEPASQKSSDSIPQVLNNEQGLAALRRLVDAGYLNADFQPACSLAIASAVAKALGDYLSFGNYFNILGTFWGKTRLDANYQGFLNKNSKAIDIEQDILTTLQS